MSTDVAVLVVFAFVYAGMILGRIPGLALDRTGVALLGAIALVTLGRVTVAHDASEVTVLEAVAGLARGLPSVRGVSFNFHTPYPGVESLSLSPEEKAGVIDVILALKRHGFPIINTSAGLKAMKENKWQRPVPMIHLVEKDEIFECCFGRNEPGVCDRCGYGVIAELSQVLSGNIPTIIQSMSLFS